MGAIRLIAAGSALLLIPLASFGETMAVEQVVVTDYRPVVARIEAGDTATARSRLQGVVTRLEIDEGDEVEIGDIVAIVEDETIPPQLVASNERIEALASQIRQAEANLARNQTLFDDGFFPEARLEDQITALDVLQRNLSSAEAERRALIARRDEGQIRAPANARVTEVRVVEQSIVSPGEVIARFATLDGVVRLSMPERHAAQIKEGETFTMRLPSRDQEMRVATVVKVYPELRNGAVIADATVEGGLDALVGERVDVLAPVGERRAVLIPRDYVSTRYGVDFVRVKVGERFVDAPVALASPLSESQDQLEVLSGLKQNDLIEKPE